MRVVVGLSCLVAAGCPDRTVATVATVPTGVETKGIPVEADLDVLFVIDDSSSTADKQALFAQNFPRFVDALDGFYKGKRNLHIGVVSTTVGTGGAQFPGCPSAAPSDDGRLHAVPVAGATVNGVACSSCSVTGTFLSDVESGAGARNANFNCPGTNPLATALPCIAELGTGGCGFEAPLEAMKRALDGSNVTNAGFLRDDAYLAVIILTDEDDCSVRDSGLFSLPLSQDDFRCQPLYAYDCDTQISATTPGHYTGCKPKTSSYLQDTSYYATFLTTVKPSGQIAVAVIGGTDAAGQPPDPHGFAIATGPLSFPGTSFTQPLALLPSCMTVISGQPAIGRPGIRLADFVSQFGKRGKYYSVCQADYSAALADIGSQLATDLSPCLEGQIDLQDANAGVPGVQPQCTVSDVLHYGTPDAAESRIHPCPMSDATHPDPSGPRPCWWIEINATACPDPIATPTHAELHIERTEEPATGTIQVVSCAVDQ
jgi:hypothetical protein